MADHTGHDPEDRRYPALRDLVLYREPAAKPGAGAVDRAALITGLEGDGENADLEIFAPGCTSQQKRNVRHVEREQGEEAETYTWRWEF